MRRDRQTDKKAIRFRERTKETDREDKSQREEMRGREGTN